MISNINIKEMSIKSSIKYKLINNISVYKRKKKLIYILIYKFPFIIFIT